MADRHLVTRTASGVTVRMIPSGERGDKAVNEMAERWGPGALLHLSTMPPASEMRPSEIAEVYIDDVSLLDILQRLENPDDRLERVYEIAAELQLIETAADEFVSAWRNKHHDEGSHLVYEKPLFIMLSARRGQLRAELLRYTDTGEESEEDEES